jgi:ethanolamine transporter
MNVISIVMLLFAVVGALDYLAGNRLGVGKEFERGVLMIGTMILSMVGMIVLAPLIAAWIQPVLTAVSDKIPFFEPSVIAGSLLANDMGGAPLAMELARTPEAGYFNGLIVGSMMGATISFSLPLSLGMTAPEQKNSRPIRQLAPDLNRAVVKLPICSALGKKVFARTPRIRGMTIRPPGTLLMLSRIGTLPIFIVIFLPIVNEWDGGPLHRLHQTPQRSFCID